MVYCPFYLDPDCKYLVTGSKDKTIRLWHTTLNKCVAVGNVHKEAITKVVWTPRNFIISCSEDRRIVIWSSKLVYLKDLGTHSHWVNCMSLNTDHVLKCSYFGFKDFNNRLEIDQLPKEVKQSKMIGMVSDFYKKYKEEYLVTGSDDNTIKLFSFGAPEMIKSDSNQQLSKREFDEIDSGAQKSSLKLDLNLEEQKKLVTSFKEIRRYVGHSKAINHVQFSPNGIFFVSASFDKTLRVWNIMQSSCLAVLRAHVAAVYR